MNPNFSLNKAACFCMVALLTVAAFFFRENMNRRNKAKIPLITPRIQENCNESENILTQASQIGNSRCEVNTEETSDGYPTEETSSTHRQRSISQTTIDKLVEECEQRRKYATMELQRAMPFRFQDIFEKLNAIPNLSDTGCIALAELLEKNVDKRTAFMMVSPDRLKYWINYTIEEYTRWSASDLWVK